MGYTLIRRYVIDANSHDDLVGLVQADIDVVTEEEFDNVANWSDVELLEYLASAIEVGNCNSVCKEFDAWVPNENIEADAGLVINQDTTDMVFENDRAQRAAHKPIDDPWSKLPPLPTHTNKKDDK